MVFVERRHHNRPHFLAGYIGVPYPVNFLENRSARLFLMLGFSSFGISAYNLIVNPGE